MNKRATEFLTTEQSRARIQNEDALINHRVSWLIGSQAFLFSAYVLLRNNPAAYELAKDGNPVAYAQYMRTLARMLYYVCTVGLAVSVASFIGVLAAYFAIEAWKEATIGGRKGLTSEAPIAHLGGLAAVLPAPIIATIWTMLLIGEWDTISKHASQTEIAAPIVAVLVVLVFWAPYHWLLARPEQRNPSATSPIDESGDQGL